MSTVQAGSDSGGGANRARRGASSGKRSGRTSKRRDTGAKAGCHDGGVTPGISATGWIGAERIGCGAAIEEVQKTGARGKQHYRCTVRDRVRISEQDL